MSDTTDQDVGNPALPQDDEMIDIIQQRRYQMILDGHAPDKDFLQLLKHTADTSMARKRLQSDNENSEKDRATIQAIAANLRQSNQNPFVAAAPVDREPPKADGPLIDMALTPENMSTTLGSPEYEDVASNPDED
ncbi:hypothetical protein CZP2022_254 [Vibrio phage C-ZP2022]|nr:hypothetical protein CZP2022_254 [Vibrio phage C-ZP2022]